MRDIFIGIDGTTPDEKRNVKFEPWDFNFSFINMIYTFSSAADADKAFFPGPDIYGKGTTLCVNQSLDFLKSKGFGGNRTPQGMGDIRVVIAGYSRGAYAALRVAQALDLAGVRVAFGGFIDIVKCTDDGTEAAITNAILDFLEERPATASLPKPQSQYDPDAQHRARIALEKDQKRRDQISSGVNKSWLPNMISWGVGSFSIPKNIASGFHARRDPAVGSRTHPMGHYPTEGNKNIDERRDFWATHSAMGGMPFRGDVPGTISRVSEWRGSRRVAEFAVGHLNGHKLLNTRSPTHPCLQAPEPPQTWYQDQHIRSQYQGFVNANSRLDGCGLDPEFEKEAMAHYIRKITGQGYKDRPPGSGSALPRWK